MEIIYNTQPGPFWDWQVAADLFLGGAGVGALLFAIGVDEWFRGKYRRMSQTGACLAPLLIAAGLLLLMVKMGRPFHLYKTYLNFNPHSPLWWGGIFQPLLVIGGVIYAWKWMKVDQEDPARRLLGRVLVPLAAIVGTYHGMLLAINVSKPLWNTGPTVISAILGFITTGIAAVLFVHLIRMRCCGQLSDSEKVSTFLQDMRVARYALVAGIVLQLGTFFLWWLSLRYGSLQDQQALAVANEQYGAMFWYLAVGVGLVLPLLLGGFAAWRGSSSSQRLQVAVMTVTSLMILGGGYFFRLAVVLGGQVGLPIQTLS